MSNYYGSTSCLPATLLVDYPLYVTTPRDSNGPMSFNIRSVAADTNGNVYIGCDFSIEKLSPDGVLSVLPVPIDSATDMVADDQGNLYVLDSPIKRIDRNGLISTIASAPPGASGIAVDSIGNIFVANWMSNSIQKIDTLGSVTTFAGSGRQGWVDGVGTNACFYQPQGVAVDNVGNLYVADTCNHSIRKIDSAGNITTIAGAGPSASGSADGTGCAALFNYPEGIAVHDNGSLYVADTGNNVIRKITPVGTNWLVITLAGNGGIGLHDGTGTNSTFYWPEKLAVSRTGNIYIADVFNGAMRIGGPPYPTISIQPQSNTVIAGSSIALSVTAAGSSNLVYRWQKDSSDLSDDSWMQGSGSRILTMSAISSSNAGDYCVVITNTYGSVTSDVATLTVHSPPTIMQEPNGLVKNALASASFTVVATGDGPLAFCWLKNGSVLADGGRDSGSSSPNLTITNLQVVDAGSYTVVVSNSWGIATSAPPAVLTVNDSLPPLLTISNPNDLRILSTASVTVTGTASDANHGESGIVSVSVEGNLAANGTASGANSASWNCVVSLVAGTNSIVVVATDGSGNSTTDNLRLILDQIPPTNKITSPFLGERWSNAVFTIQGTASDNLGISNVIYQLNSGLWTTATTADGWNHWSASVQPSAGTNIIKAFSTDLAGNASKTNIASFIYVPSAPLVVQINGEGTVSPNYNGQLLQVGKNYSMTAAAVPGSGFKFTNWTGSFQTNQPRLTFLMASNLTLIASFVDVTRPAIVITSPTANQRCSNSMFTVKGTASDNAKVVNVFFQLNGGSWTTVTTTNAWTNWTANLTLTPGTNTAWAYAVDTSGNNSPSNKVSFLYIPSAMLTVQTNGLGGITPADNGKLLAIGTNYTLTANPGHNWIFSNWVASGSANFVSNNPALKFTMQSNLVIEGNFVTNLFLAAQGAYNGLFAPANPPRQQTNSGSFTVNVTSSGVLSGNFFLGSETIPLVNGQFDVSGAAQVHSTRHGGNPLTASLQLDLADRSLHGIVSDGSFVAMLHGDQSVFNSTHKATNYQGQYTLIIPGTNDPTVGPFGTSYGTVTVDASGSIAFGGGLADGTTSVSRSSVVSKDGFWPFYVPLYGGAGSLWGWNYFTNRTVVSAPSLSWINATNSAKTAVYHSGFTNQQTTVIGSLYTSTNKPLLSLTNAQVILEGGNLPFSIINQITWASNNTITVLHNAQNTNGLTLRITTSGLISGSFLNPANAKQTITVNGVLLQNQTNAAGYFLSTNQSGAFILQPQ